MVTDEKPMTFERWWAGVLPMMDSWIAGVTERDVEVAKNCAKLAWNTAIDFNKSAVVACAWRIGAMRAL